MKIKIDEAKTLEFKIDTSSGCALEDLEGYLRFSFGGVEYGFPAKISEGCFQVEVPPFKNVVNDQITESISKNKSLIVRGRLDVIANKNTYVSPWSGDIDIEVPVSMKISEGDEILKDGKKKVTVSDPDKESILEEFNKLFDPKKDEAVKASKFKDVLVTEKTCKKDPEGGAEGAEGGIDGKNKDEGREILVTEEEKTSKTPKKSRFAQDLEKTYVKTGA